MNLFFKSLLRRNRAIVTGSVLFIALASFISPAEKIKIYLVGDSTMCPYDNNRYPQAGWGMPFARFFDSSVTIDNRARGGRSSKSFIDENLWKSIADSLKEGDYVLIQFGHNDAANSAAHPNRMVTPEVYGKYLARYITEARSKKATPVLITPVTKRKFDTNGRAMESHAPYSKAMAEVAASYKVPLIDLDGKSRELVKKWGPNLLNTCIWILNPMRIPYTRGESTTGLILMNLVPGKWLK